MNELDPEYKKAKDNETIAYNMPNRPSDFFGELFWKFKSEQQKRYI